MKDRDISNHDFLQALQKEYICLFIRSKIYVYENDKFYFYKLLSKKKSAIQSLSKKISEKNIFDDELVKNKTYKDIVPEFGFPNFIYNITANKDQQKFPYAGTIVRTADGLYGISNSVDFENNILSMLDPYSGNVVSYPMSEVKRISYQLCDEFYYYYPKSTFRVKGNGTGVLQKYDMDTKISTISIDGMISSEFNQIDICRVL